MTFKAWAIKRKDGTLEMKRRTSARFLLHPSKAIAETYCASNESPVRVTVTVEERTPTEKEGE